MSDTLSTLRALERDTTDPTWLVRRVDETYRIYIEAEDDGPPRYITLAVLGSPVNARLIVAARNALPALLRVAEAAQVLVELDKAERPGVSHDMSLAMQQLADAYAALEAQP